MCHQSHRDPQIARNRNMYRAASKELTIPTVVNISIIRVKILRKGGRKGKLGCGQGCMAPQGGLSVLVLSPFGQKMVTDFPTLV